VPQRVLEASDCIFSHAVVQGKTWQRIRRSAAWLLPKSVRLLDACFELSGTNLQHKFNSAIGVKGYGSFSELPTAIQSVKSLRVKTGNDSEE